MSGRRGEWHGSIAELVASPEAGDWRPGLLKPLTLALGFAAATLMSLGAGATCPGDLLVAPGVANYENFGNAAAIHGDVAVIGARQHRTSLGFTGAAYVFRRTGWTWGFESMLESSGLGLAFGESVAASDDLVVVGAPSDLRGGLALGAAHVFRHSASGWEEESKLTAHDPGITRFGWSVAAGGDTVVVGAPNDNEGGWGAGAAYVFRRGPGGWEEEQKLMPSDARLGLEFGSAVAVSGDRCVVGAIYDDHFGTLSGAAYVFHRTDAGWVEEAKLLASDGTYYSRFGSSVSMSDDAILVGQPQLGALPLDVLRGAAYVFRRDGTAWRQEAKLGAIGREPWDGFGSAVALDCDLAVIGAPLIAGAGGVAEAGAAYVFERTTRGWEQRDEFSDCPAANDNYYYGSTVALSGDAAIVATRYDDTIGENAGAAFAIAVEPRCGCQTWSDLFATIESAQIDREGVRQSLRSKAYAASRAFERGQVSTSGNVLCALVHECDAQDGQHVEHESAEEIRECVRSLATALTIPLGSCSRLRNRP